MNRTTCALLWGLALAMTSCGPDSKPAPEAPSHPGKQLHTTYCGSCHSLPQPGELDQKTWKNHILVRMGAYMGIYTDNQQYFDSVPEKWVEPGYGGERVRKGNIYPKKPMLSRQEWEQLREYILQNAPVASTGPAGMLPIHTEGIPGFIAHPLQPDPNLQPLVTALHIDATRKVLRAAFIQQEVVRVDPEGKITMRSDGFMGPVQILIHNGIVNMVDIGSMGGSDNPVGKVVAGKEIVGLKLHLDRPVFDSLQRPVFLEYGDLDGDQDDDAVICEFGYHFGELAWHEQIGPGEYKRHTLHPDDGAVCARIHDFNEDGRPDILALFANSDERLVLYLNNGDKTFKQQQLFRYSPTYGNTYMELVDWDSDGKMDILQVNGDNGDYPPILKSSHGIRLYRNMGNLKFEEKFYLGMNGAYGLRARDFDKDGDFDLAAVSFYPDYQARADEAFLYYQNDGKDNFTAYTFPEAKLSRWMVVDAGDLDGDGDQDIALGAFNVKSGDADDARYNRWMYENVPILWLENTKVK